MHPASWNSCDQAGSHARRPSSILTDSEFAAALREAEFLRLPIAGLNNGSDGARTRTELESMFMALVRRHRLPRPEVNVHVDRYEVDFLWPRQRLIVEVDGWESHRSRTAFEEDRSRDARLKLLGYDVLRFTWWQIETDGPAVAKTVQTVLAREGRHLYRRRRR